MSIVGKRPLFGSHTRLGALALVMTMLAACSATSGSDDGGSVNSASGATATPAPTPPVVAQEGPLDEYMLRIFGFGRDMLNIFDVSEGTNIAELQAAMDRQHRIQEADIAACMAAQGFTYLPNLEQVSRLTLIDGPARGTREFAEQYGFGWSSGGLVGLRIQSTISGTDPNDALLREMSAAEREAWTRALSGGDFMAASAASTAQVEAGELPDAGLFGCRGLATNPHYNPANEANDEFRALHLEWNRFPASVDNHPRIAELNLEWSICLAEQGFPGRSNPQQLSDEMAADWSLIFDMQAIFELMENWDWEAGPEGPPHWELDEDGIWRPTPTGAGVDAYRALEAVLAITDVDCREQLFYEQRRTAIEHQLQQEFIDLHRNELEAWATFAETQRAGR